MAKAAQAATSQSLGMRSAPRDNSARAIIVPAGKITAAPDHPITHSTAAAAARVTVTARQAIQHAAAALNESTSHATW
jgi:hypothetical protein